MAKVTEHAVTIYRPGSPPVETMVAILGGDWPAFRDIEAAVKPLLGGADIERVRVWLPATNKYTDMFVGETSALQGLPINLTATAIYQANIRRWRPNEVSDNLPSIYGPAVVFWHEIWS